MISYSFMLMSGIFFAGYLSNIPAFFVVGAVMCIICLLFLNYKSCSKMLLFAFCGIILYTLGGAYSYNYQNNLFSRAKAYLEINDKKIVGTVTDDISVSDSNVKLVLKTKSNILISLRCYTDEEFLPGDIVTVYNPKTEILDRNNRIISKYTNLLGKNTVIFASCYGGQAKKTGINSKYSVSRYFYQLRKKTFSSLVKHLDYQEAAFAYSLISSDKSYMSGETYSFLSGSGLIHLSSVSGFHFVFLCGIFSAIAVLFFPYHKTRIFFTLSLAFVFMLYTGGGAPVFRAFVMFVGTQIGDLFYSRRIKTSTCLIFATVFIMFQNPMCVFNVSFLLSFGATYGIVFLNKNITSFFKGKILKKIFVINLCVTIFTLPVIYSVFGRITVFSAISNFAVDGVVGFAMLLSFILWGADLFCKSLCAIIAPILNITVKYIFFVMKTVTKMEVFRVTGAFSIVCAVFLTGFLFCLIKYLNNIKNKRLLASVTVFFVAFMTAFSFQYSDKNTYATFIGNSSGISIDVINNHKHIVVSNVKDFFYNKYNSSVKQNEVIETFVIVDKEIENKNMVIDMLKDYKIEKIIGFSSVIEKIKNDKSLKSKFYCLENSENEISCKLENNELLYIEINDINQRILLTDKYDYISKENNDIKACSLFFFGTNKNRENARKLAFDSSVNFYCNDNGTLINLCKE